MPQKKILPVFLTFLLILSAPLPAHGAPAGFTGQILEIHPEADGNYRLVVKHKGGTSEFTINPQTLIRASLGASQVEAGDQILLDQNAALAEITDGFIDSYGTGAKKSTAPPQPPKGPEIPERPEPAAAAGGDHARPPAPPNIPKPPKGPPDNKLPNEPAAPPAGGGMPPDAQAANENLQKQAMDMMQQQGGGGEQPDGSQQADGSEQEEGGKKQSSSEKKPKPWEKELKDPREHKDTLDLDEPALSLPGEETAAPAPETGEAEERKPEDEAPQGPFGNRMQVISVNRTEETVTLELQDADQRKTSASFAADQSVMIVLRPEDLTLDMLVQLEVASEEEGALRTVTVLTVTAEKSSREDLESPPPAQAPRGLPGPDAQIDEDLWLDLQNMSEPSGISQDAQ